MAVYTFNYGNEDGNHTYTSLKPEKDKPEMPPEPDNGLEIRIIPSEPDTGKKEDLPGSLMPDGEPELPN